jgi:hypothetical protein
VPDSLQCDMLQPDGHWHRIRLDPFTASMSVIGGSYVCELAEGADLYAPPMTREISQPPWVVPFEESVEHA